MKTTTLTEQEVDAKILKVSAGVRYWEDATVDGIEDEDGDLIPCRSGDCWQPEIDIDTGQITNWKQGVTADIHYKVCDAGEYKVFDDSGKLALQKEGYVPDLMCPEENGYGDYIIMKVNESGFIHDWQPSFEDFEPKEKGEHFGI